MGLPNMKKNADGDPHRFKYRPGHPRSDDVSHSGGGKEHVTSATHFPNYVRFNEERCTGCAACLRGLPDQGHPHPAPPLDPHCHPMHRLRGLHPDLPCRGRQRRHPQARAYRGRPCGRRPGLARALCAVPGRDARRRSDGVAPNGVSPHHRHVVFPGNVPVGDR